MRERTFHNRRDEFAISLRKYLPNDVVGIISFYCPQIWLKKEDALFRSVEKKYLYQYSHYDIDFIYDLLSHVKINSCMVICNGIAGRDGKTPVGYVSWFLNYDINKKQFMSELICLTKQKYNRLIHNIHIPNIHAFLRLRTKLIFKTFHHENNIDQIIFEFLNNYLNFFSKLTDFTRLDYYLHTIKTCVVPKFDLITD